MLLPPIVLSLGARLDRNGGKLRVYGRCSFRDAGRTGRGEETRVATLPKTSGRVLTLSGCARKTDWEAMPGRGRSELSYSMVTPLGQCPLQGTTALRV